MVHDPIVEEVRAIREAIAKEHGNDVTAIVLALQRRQAESGRKLVSFPPRRVAEKQRQRKAG